MTSKQADAWLNDNFPFALIKPVRGWKQQHISAANLSPASCQRDQAVIQPSTLHESRHETTPTHSAYQPVAATLHVSHPARIDVYIDPNIALNQSSCFQRSITSSAKDLPSHSLAPRDVHRRNRSPHPGSTNNIADGFPPHKKPLPFFGCLPTIQPASSMPGLKASESMPNTGIKCQTSLQDHEEVEDVRQICPFNLRGQKCRLSRCERLHSCPGYSAAFPTCTGPVCPAAKIHIRATCLSIIKGETCDSPENCTFAHTNVEVRLAAEKVRLAMELLRPIEAQRNQALDHLDRTVSLQRKKDSRRTEASVRRTKRRADRVKRAVKRTSSARD